MSEIIRLYAFYVRIPRPTHATLESAGLDVHALRVSKEYPEHSRRLYGTGLFLLPENHPTVPRAAWASDPIPENFFLDIRPRSSSFKSGLTVFPGTIDRDYRDEILIGVTGPLLTEGDLFAKPIAQLVLTPYRPFCAPCAVVREGGFGSTDAQR